MSETSFKIKCSKSASARRFSLSNPTIASLCSQVEASWGINDPSFWYVDDDGDRISVESDHELGAAIAAMRDNCVNLSVDFNLGTADTRDHPASQTSSSCSSSDDDDGFISVVIDSEAGPGNIVAPSAHSSDVAVSKHSDFTEASTMVVNQQALIMQQQAQELEQAYHRKPEEDAPPAPLKLPPAVVHGDPMASESASIHRISESTHLDFTLRMQHQIQALHDELDSLREQAAKDAEYARQIQRCTVEKAEERFDAATSVLKLQLREAQAKHMAAEFQIKLLSADRKQVHAPQSTQVHDPNELSDAIEALRVELEETIGEKFLLNERLETQAAEQKKQLKEAWDLNDALAVENAALQQRVQLALEDMERMRLEIVNAEAHAARDVTHQAQLRAEVDRFKNEAAAAVTQRVAAAASASSPTLPRSLSQPPAAVGGAGAAKQVASPTVTTSVPSSASNVPQNHHANWKRVARAAGSPKPSDADIEKFDRALAVLRSMSFDISEDAMFCVVINNGDVQVVVDQMLASVA